MLCCAKLLGTRPGCTACEAGTGETAVSKVEAHALRCGIFPQSVFRYLLWMAEPSCIIQHNPTINTEIPWPPESCFTGEPACRNSILYLSSALSVSFISLMICSFLGRCLQTSPWTPVCICLHFICLSVTLTYTNHSSHFVSFFCDLQCLQLGGDSIVADQVWNGSGCPWLTFLSWRVPVIGMVLTVYIPERNWVKKSKNICK